jgi:hypothetical protein
MSNVYRVGLLLGVLGAIGMYALSRMAALTAAVGVVALGLVAGLAMAKWLEWDWYGRQIEAGLRAGLIACILGTIAGIVALIAQGPHDVSSLAAQSHLGAVNLGPLARTLGGLGWTGVDIVILVLACLAGIGLAVGATGVFAFGKNRAAVDAVSRARQAAEALRSGRPWSATVSRPISPNALSAGSQWLTSSPSVPLASNGSRMTNAPHATNAPRATNSPAPQASLQTYGGDSEALADFYTAPAQPAAPSKRRSTAAPEPVDAQPTGDEAMNYLNDDTRMREAMRDALSMWADETEEGAEDQPTQRRKREPKGDSKREPSPSAFLTSEQRPKRSARKKTNTRDWLC